MDRVALPETLERDLRGWLEGHPEGHERAALLFFRRYDRGGIDLPSSVRWLAADVFLLDDDWIRSSSACHVEINLRKFPEVYLKCELAGYDLGFVHSHPSGALLFSELDDQNEKNILRGYGGCNGPDAALVNLILCNGHWIGRIRAASDPNAVTQVRHIAVVGSRLNLHLAEAEDPSPILARQEAAFGKPFNKKMQSLRIAVVGLGGTGSPIATLLARAGVGELVLIDGDKLEDTNLNRVRGYAREDVGDPKSEALSRYITKLGLGGKVADIHAYLYDSPRAVDVLSGCDLVFGCTDDVLGREIMNLAVYYYGVPLIDVGLTGQVAELDDQVELIDHRGRISTITPEAGACLRCQRVVTDQKLKYEDAIRRRPELRHLDRETLRKEFYIIGGGEEAPGVGPFTSATADFAVATLMDLIHPFRHMDTDLRMDNVWVDFIHLVIHSNEPALSDQCFCCGPNGIELGSLETNRLGMPILGSL